MNLLDIFEGREPHQQAIDRLEQARIAHLEEKMDYYAKHGMATEFKKAKAERDSYLKVQDECMGYGTLVGEGQMKQMMHKDAERMSREAFCEKYGNEDWVGEFWDNVSGPLDEAGIGQDIVNRTEKMARATPQSKPGAVASTVKNAAKWLAGKGGPGKEGPTYESAQKKNSEITEEQKEFAYKVVCDGYDKGNFVNKNDAIYSGQYMIYYGEKEYTDIKVIELATGDAIWEWHGKKDDNDVAPTEVEVDEAYGPYGVKSASDIKRIERAKEREKKDVGMYRKQKPSVKKKYIDQNIAFARTVDEGWSDAVVAQRTGRPRTPYSVYIKGKKWKDFENDDHAEAVANKLRAKFKQEGRDPSVITIAATDYDKEQGVAEGKLTPEQSKELKGYIDAYRDATDPEAYYDQDPDGDNPDPNEILGTIAGKFGQEIADTIANGPSMHFPRPGHAWHQSDPMDPMFDKAPRVTKSGKVNRQDVNVLKKNIQRRVGDHTRPNLPEQGVAEDTDSWFRVTVKTPNGKTHNLQVPANSHGTAKRKALAYCAKNGIAGAEFVSAMRMPTLDEQGVAEGSKKPDPADNPEYYRYYQELEPKKQTPVKKHKSQDPDPIENPEYYRKEQGVAEAGMGMWGDKGHNAKSQATRDLERSRNEKKQAAERARAEEQDRAWWKTQGKKDVDEASTDYSKRRQREKDIDAGKPVAKQRQPKMTDYQKRRAQQKKEMELGEDYNNESRDAVESAIIRRIMVAHTDLLKKFGPQKVMDAAQAVADEHSDVEEIGTSDVSAFVQQVERYLAMNY